jgi:hypothetical protein
MGAIRRKGIPLMWRREEVKWGLMGRCEGLDDLIRPDVLHGPTDQSCVGQKRFERSLRPSTIVFGWKGLLMLGRFSTPTLCGLCAHVGWLMLSASRPMRTLRIGASLRCLLHVMPLGVCAVDDRVLLAYGQL